MSAVIPAVKEHFMLASDVKGHKVVNKNAEDLGKVDDYMLDLETQYFTNWIRKSSIPITISNI